MQFKAEVQTMERMVLRFTVEADSKAEAQVKALSKARRDGCYPLYATLEKT